MSDSVETNLQLQLSELELVRSMFPDYNDVRLDDPLAEKQISLFLESTAVDRPRLPATPLSYTVSVCKGARLHVEATGAYPSVEQAEVYLKTDSSGREFQAELNRQLAEHLDTTLCGGELAVGVAVAWVQEREEVFTKYSDSLPSKASKSSNKDLLSFTRLWIYSHHIYSKTKRRDILGLASDHSLCGFSMPGKPGVICLEGYTRDCNEAWAVIRNVNALTYTYIALSEPPKTRFVVTLLCQTL
jgi:hypothetical protein